MRIYASITFDDGYMSHLSIAHLLYKQGVEATFFVITHLKHFEGKPLVTVNPRYIELISDLGHEIGSHSCTHPRLDTLPPSDVEKELRESKMFLEKLLGRKVLGFAYPGGFYNKNVVLITARYYEYARLAGKRFEARSWNSAKRVPYLVEGVGARELIKLPIKYLLHKDIKPVVIFHDDPPYLVSLVIKYLKQADAELVTLRELVRLMLHGEV